MSAKMDELKARVSPKLRSLIEEAETLMKHDPFTAILIRTFMAVSSAGVVDPEIRSDYLQKVITNAIDSSVELGLRMALEADSREELLDIILRTRNKINKDSRVLRNFLSTMKMSK